MENGFVFPGPRNLPWHPGPADLRPVYGRLLQCLHAARLPVVYVSPNVAQSGKEAPGTFPTSMTGTGTSLGVGQTGHQITLAVH